MKNNWFEISHTSCTLRRLDRTYSRRLTYRTAMLTILICLFKLFYLFYDVFFFWSSAKHTVLCIWEGLSHHSVNKIGRDNCPPPLADRWRQQACLPYVEKEEFISPLTGTGHTFVTTLITVLNASPVRCKQITRSTHTSLFSVRHQVRHETGKLLSQYKLRCNLEGRSEDESNKE